MTPEKNNQVGGGLFHYNRGNSWIHFNICSQSSMTTEKWEERFQKQFLLEGSECTFVHTPDVLEITDFIQAELSRSRNEVVDEIKKELPEELPTTFRDEARDDKTSVAIFNAGFDQALSDIRAMIEKMKQ